MSLALKSGYLRSLVLSSVMSPSITVALPQLPRLSQLLPRIGHQEEVQHEDSRLEDLRKHLEEGNEVPFGFDNGAILKAAPKKKLSRHKHRQKLYAPGNKQIKPLGNLVRCPACGHVKRSHFMCMHCFAEIRTFLKAKKKALFGEPAQPQADLDPVDEKILYPGKYLSMDQIMLERKHWIPKREEPLEYDPSQVRKRRHNK